MKATWFERGLALFAPRQAMQRMRDRIDFETAARAYEGAARGRNTDSWVTPGTSADAEIATAGPVLRDRARDLVRNNPHATKGIAGWVTNLVGSGIMPRPVTGDDARNDKVKEAFKRWCDQCDAGGQLDFYGLQALSVTGMVEGGEMLSRRRWRRASDGLAIPVQIQLLEPDFIDSARHGDLANGNTAISGIEFSPIGQRSAYWLFGQHPGGAVLSMNARLASAPVPASDVTHLYEMRRTQVRGVTWLAPVMRALRDHADYKFAERIRKKAEASYVGAVVGDDDSDWGLNPDDATKTGDLRPQVVDGRGNPIEYMSPGMFAYLRNGKDIKFNTPAAVGGFSEYDEAELRAVAAGLRLPYEVLTGDLSQINFSSMRAGLIEFRRLVTAIQWMFIIPMVCAPWWRWFCAAAYLAGEIDSPDIPVEWSPPKFEWVDPYKDILADVLAIRAGIKTPQDVIAATGRPMQEVLDELKAWTKILDDYGLVLDTDPRNTTLKGLMQKSATAALIGDGQGDQAAAA